MDERNYDLLAFFFNVHIVIANNRNEVLDNSYWKYTLGPLFFKGSKEQFRIQVGSNEFNFLWNYLKLSHKIGKVISFVGISF